MWKGPQRPGRGAAKTAHRLQLFVAGLDGAEPLPDPRHRLVATPVARGSAPMTYAIVTPAVATAVQAAELAYIARTQFKNAPLPRETFGDCTRGVSRK